MPLSLFESGQADVILPAPAKFNHFLHVCARRTDGYHELQTVFQFLDIADRLAFRLRDDGQILLHTEFSGVAADDNLIVRAAKLLQQRCDVRQGVDIEVEKILPMGGGIGGGSSNAATTLAALNQLWQLHLSSDELQAVGLQLGADVPIFLHGHAAWAEGVGELLTDLDLAEKWYVLIIPDCHVSTAAIFSHSELTRDSKIKTIAAFLEQGQSDTESEAFRNDCEPLVRKLYPPVDAALNALSRYAKARMTGTGACVFAAFDSQQAAENVRQQLDAHFQVLISKATNQSPLITALQA